MKNLILTLLSSWLVAPVSAGIAHLYGYGQDPILIATLLMLGTAVPFQLVNNEIISALRVQVKKEIPRWFMVLYVSLQVISLSYPLIVLVDTKIHLLSTILMAALVSGGNYISLNVSTIYYGLISQSEIRGRESCLVGFMPGFVQAVIYIIVIFVSQFFFDFSEGFLLILFLPSAAQLFFIRFLRRNTCYAYGEFDRFALVVLFAGISIILLCVPYSMHVRELIASSSGKMALVVITFLNMVFSLILVVARALFITNRKVKIKAWWFESLVWTACLGLCGLFVVISDGVVSLIVKFATIQIVQVFVILKTRSLVFKLNKNTVCN